MVIYHTHLAKTYKIKTRDIIPVGCIQLIRKLYMLNFQLSPPDVTPGGRFQGLISEGTLSYDLSHHPFDIIHPLPPSDRMTNEQTHINTIPFRATNNKYAFQ